MERLSHDLNLALEESDCGRHERRKFGVRRRTRSAGNLPAAVAVSVVEDGSSSSPPQAPLVTQPLSDSDDIQHQPHKSANIKSRHYCQIGNFESDSFNENFSPTRPANARRKRKFKKMPVDYADGNRSPPIEILSISTEPNALRDAILLHNQATFVNVNKLKLKNDRHTFCGKRKWSYRDKSDVCEMRERSFSGGCSSKSAYFSKNDIKSKKYDIDKKKKDLLQPGKIVLKSQNNEDVQLSSFSNTPSLPGSSSFNFVYKNSSKNGTPTLSKLSGYSIATDLPPIFDPISSRKSCFDLKFFKKSKLLNKSHPPCSLRNPLQFEDSNCGMECAGNESSSLSSSDSDGVVTNDSDREGDDELTDWPGIEELKVFKSLTFKTSKTISDNTSKSLSNIPPQKRLKKEKVLVKNNWGNSKNKFKKKRPKVDSGNDDDAMISDSKTVVELDDEVVSRENILQPHSSFSSFSDIKNAGGSGENANQKFFRSFQAFQEKAKQEDDLASQTPRSNFTLQKTSSSDLNVSEKSPQSDHYCSEHSMGNAGVEVREIRAGCRRIRDERPGFLILSAANEQLSKFLQDSRQYELKLPSLNDPDEFDKLTSLAKLYSLEFQLEMGRPVLRKTSNTMQAIRVEHSYHNFPSDHKRRCYGEDQDSSLSISDHNSITSVNDLEDVQLTANGQKLDYCDLAGHANAFTHTLVDKSLLHPGDID